MQIFKTKINEGIIYMLIASFCFALMGVFIKILSGSLGVLEITFFRNIFGAAAIGITMLSVPLRNKGGRAGLLLFRAFIGFSAMLAWFYNIAHIPLADAMTFSRTAPIFTAMIACFVLKERIGAGGWIAIVVGFVGIVFIMKPTGLSLKTTDLMGLFSGLGAAMAYTSVRELKKYYDTRTIVFWFMFISGISSLMMIIANEYLGVTFLGEFFGDTTMPRGVEWVYIVCLGAFATSGQVFMTRAYGATKAGLAAAVSYADIVFAVIFGAILWGAFPDLAGLFGIMLVILGGILVAKEKV
ncbi:MAG: DMT family transporter [Campylobacteraceae bacterium]|jgi:drug/metabolite transporter (DMT)-like permease|nr:DMT family transporter [Campylobacteraceae bacterium]